jgi:hypothetical protein
MNNSYAIFFQVSCPCFVSCRCENNFTPSSTILYDFFDIGINIGTFTPKGFEVAFYIFECVRAILGYIEPAPIKPKPPALLTALASL